MEKRISVPVINMIATGKNIEQLRKQNRMSVKELQEIFGFTSPQAIYKWQWGDSLPDIQNLLLMSQMFHTPMENILVYDNQDVYFLPA